METIQSLQPVKMNVAQTITDIAFKLENSKLVAATLKSIKLKNKKLADYLGVTTQQSYLFVALFVLQAKVDMVEIIDITNFLGLTFIDSANLNIELQALSNLKLIEITGESNTRRRKSRGIKYYNVNRDVTDAVYENRPIVFRSPELLDIYGFCTEVSGLIVDREMLGIDTNEMFIKIKMLEYTNVHLPVIAKLEQSKIPLEERAFLYEMCNDFIIHRKSTSMMKTLDDMYDNPRQRMSKVREFVNKSNILFQLELITASESRFANDQQLDLATDTIEMLLGEDAILFDTKTKSKNIISSGDIKGKELFFEGKLKNEIEFLTKTLQQEQYNEMKYRLEEQGLTPGINVLLYGHPGTGKTELCYQLSKQTGRDIVAVDLSQVRNMFFGESEKKVKDIFYNYRKLADKSQLTPILLINEADGLLAKRRENNMRSIDQTENTIQNILLEEIERFKGIILCTSNLVQNLDSAFERRFLFKIKFEAPSVTVKELIWKNKMPWLNNEMVLDLAAKFPFSGGQIDNIAKKVAIHKVLNGEFPDKEQLLDFCSSETLQHKACKVGYN